jgi:hypothetical protein
MHPTPHHEASHVRRVWARVMPGVRPFFISAMYELIQTKVFAVGFSSVLFLFVVANIYSFYQVPSGNCFDCFEEFGVPFALGGHGGFATVTNLLLFGFIADVWIAGMSSFLVGLAVSKLYKSHSKESDSGGGAPA